jgi:cobalt-precorrin-5B (C1)-methyltransferase
MAKSKQKLRRGFTTGTCAAVTAKAAWSLLAGKKMGLKLPLLFPDGKYRKMTLENCELRKFSSIASIIKDAGDDPDVTDKALISSEVKFIQKGEITENDHILECGKAKVVIRGGEGVGIVTKRGLETAVGKYAVNPVPQKMIIDNLLDAGCGIYDEIILVVISIKNGQQLAQKTLNPTLGIEGGLSILGTTGIVEPKSHAAYIKTIEILLNGLSLEGCEAAVLCTGARTLNSAKGDFPELPEFAFIRIGDFIADSLKYASKLGFKKIIVSCMPGKLFKYSSGHEYTHAHNIKLDINEISPILVENNAADAIINKALKNVTFRGVLQCLNKELKEKVLDDIGKKAVSKLSSWAGKTPFKIRCYGYEKNLIGSWKN